MRFQLQLKQGTLMETKFQNLKIAITDNDHLKAVCEVLESTGYTRSKHGRWFDSDKIILTTRFGVYARVDLTTCTFYKEKTLTDLLKMRDEMVKHNAKSSQE